MAACSGWSAPCWAAWPPPPSPRRPRLESRGVSTRLEGAVKEDFDGLLERRVIRVAAPYSRSLYFNDKGRERGLSADFVRDFERHVNQKYRKQLGKRPITVIIRPTTRDRLLKHVADGLADVAVGNLTVTEERLELVDFVAPDSVRPVSELVITGPKSPPVEHLRRPLGKDRPRPQVVELLREPRSRSTTASSRRGSRRPPSSSSRTPWRTRT